MGLENFAPNYDFDQFGYNDKGNNKRNEDDFLRLQSTRFVEYASRFSNIALQEKEIKQQYKDLDAAYKADGFDVSTAKKGVKTFIRKLKKPDEQNVLDIIHEWIEKDNKLLNAIRGLVDVDESTKEQWGTQSDAQYQDRLKKIGDYSKENYRRAVEDLGMQSTDFSREDLAKRAHYGEKNAMVQLWELDNQIAKEQGLPQPEKPDYIKELEKPKSFTDEEIQQAKILNHETAEKLEKFMIEHNIKEDEEYWLDLNISTLELMQFEMNVIAPWYRLPKELRNEDMEYLIGMIKEYERYTAKWYDHLSSKLNPAMATILPARLKTKGNINNFGVSAEQSKKYLDWCRQFMNEEYIFFVDPNYQDDPTLKGSDWIRKVYVGGHPYPENIVKEGHPDGKMQGVYEYPEEPDGYYTLERKDLFLGQPYFPRDLIFVNETEKFRHIKLEYTRKLLDVEILPAIEIETLKNRGKFGSDYFVHLVNEQFIAFNSKNIAKQSDEFIEKLFEVFTYENIHTVKGDEFIATFIVGTKKAKFFWDFEEHKFKKEVTNLNEDEIKTFKTSDWGPKFLILSGEINKDKFNNILNNNELWNVTDLNLGYQQADDEVYMNYKQMPEYERRGIIATPIKNPPAKPKEQEIPGLDELLAPKEQEISKNNTDDVDDIIASLLD